MAASTHDAHTLREACAKANQSHVFDLFDRGMGRPEEAQDFLQQVSELDLDRVNVLFRETMAAADAMASEPEELQPIPDAHYAQLSSTSAGDRQRWWQLGMQAMAAGEVGLILLAGGQGTRLGFDKPKGMYDIGLPSHKSLFQLQAQRLLKTIEQAARFAGKASVDIPLYIMTSPMTDADTRAYWEENDFLGLPRESVFFFQQGTLPCMTLEGKVILESPTQVARAPDGNGGIYLALHRSGALADMERRGVKYLHAYCVDNATVRVPDPVFVGFNVDQGADLGAKTVSKTGPEEKVGVLCLRGGRPSVVEYSEIDAATAARRKPDGSLEFGAGNICIHFYTREFLQHTCAEDKLPKIYHIAKKKIPFADPVSGQRVKPAVENGVKLESFIFDVFPMASRMTLFEVAREDEFAPVKNAPGSATDSPDTARHLSLAQHSRWLRAAGVHVPDDAQVEVSPLVSVDGDGLAALAGARLLGPALVAREGEPLPSRDLESEDVVAEGVTHAVLKTDAGATLHVYRLGA